MFGKDKVKGHNRLVKGKKGFKVTRIGDFLRKKDDNKKRNLALGIGATAVLGIGASLLLKRKVVKLSSLKNGLKGATSNTPKYPKGTTIKTKEMVVDVKATKSFDKLPDPWQSPIPSKYSGRGSKLLVKKEVSQSRIRAKDAVTSDIWKTSIRKDSTEMLIKPKVEKGQLLLPPAKKPLTMKRQKNINKVEQSVINMRNTQKNYDSLPLDMKVTVQMEKALSRPSRTSNLGRPPESTGLKTILDDRNKTSIDKVISKAKRKVGDRLKRESSIRDKKESNVKKNS